MMYVWVPVPQPACRGLGQFCGIGSLLSSTDSRDQTWVPRLGGQVPLPSEQPHQPMFFSFFDTFFHWTWSSLVYPDWQPKNGPRSICRDFPSSRITGRSVPLALAFSMVAGVWTSGSRAFPPLSCFPTSHSQLSLFATLSCLQVRKYNMLWF